MEVKKYIFFLQLIVLTFSHEINENSFEKLNPLIFSGAGISEECKSSSHHFLKSLKNLDLWALKMLDASAKLPSGILSGNLNQLGDFDECLDVVAENDKFRGKYCLPLFQPHITSNSSKLSEIQKLVLASEMFPSNFDEVTHLFPKSSQLGFAFCIPSTCSNQEFEIVLTKMLQDFFSESEIQVDVRLSEEMCHTKKETFATQNVLFLTGFVVIFSTIFYRLNAWKILSSSVLENWKNSISTQSTSSDIACVHGVRFFTMVLIILFHKAMEIYLLPLSNRSYFISLTRTFGANIFHAVMLYTELFMSLSALLTSYALIARLKNGKKVQIWREIAVRYLRLVPSMAIVMFLDAIILPNIAEGPQYSLFIDNPANNCRRFWWRNFFLIQNWFGIENVCVTPTYHIAVDFQLTIVGILFSILLVKHPKGTQILILFLAFLTALSRFYVSYTQGITYYIHFGLRTSEFYEFNNFLHTNTFLRFPAYAVGLIGGYNLQNCTKLSENLQQIGNYIGIAFFVLTFAWTFFISSASLLSALYSAISPVLFCLPIIWFIFTSQMGHKNILTSLFEWKFFVISTKFSYAIMLIHFSFFHFNHAQIRTGIEFKLLTTLIDANEIIAYLAAAALLKILVESPFDNWRKKYI